MTRRKKTAVVGPGSMKLTGYHFSPRRTQLSRVKIRLHQAQFQRTGSASISTYSTSYSVEQREQNQEPVQYCSKDESGPHLKTPRPSVEAGRAASEETTTVVTTAATTTTHVPSNTAARSPQLIRRSRTQQTSQGHTVPIQPQKKIHTRNTNTESHWLQQISSLSRSPGSPKKRSQISLLYPDRKRN